MKWTRVESVMAGVNSGLGVLNLYCYLYRGHHWYSLAVAIANFGTVVLMGYLYTRDLK